MAPATLDSGFVKGAWCVSSIGTSQSTSTSFMAGCRAVFSCPITLASNRSLTTNSAVPRPARAASNVTNGMRTQQIQTNSLDQLVTCSFSESEGKHSAVVLMTLHKRNHLLRVAHLAIRQHKHLSAVSRNHRCTQHILQWLEYFSATKVS